MNIIINEFAYNLSEFHFNLVNAVYWLSWTLDWEKLILLRKVL